MAPEKRTISFSLQQRSFSMGLVLLVSAVSEGKRSCPFEVLRGGVGVHVSMVG